MKAHRANPGPIRRAAAPPPNEGHSTERWDIVAMLGRDADNVELASLLKRRGVVTRLRGHHLKALEVYAALSNCTREERTSTECRVSATKRGDVAKRTLTVKSRGLVVVGRSAIVCAVVAAARTTRRPMAALTALATRYLLEGLAEERVVELAA